MVVNSRNNNVLKQNVITKVIALVALVIFVTSSWAWWQKVRNNPDRIFYSAIENSLRTRSITKQIWEGGSNSQTTRIEASPSLLTNSLTTITITNNIGEERNSVQTEAINSSSAEYVRWTKIETNQKNKKGEKLNFNSVLNIWGKSTNNKNDLMAQTRLALLSSPVLIGDFNTHNRQTLMNIVRSKNVYTYDKSKVQRKVEDGRQVYTYEVEIHPIAFYELAKKYGEITNIDLLKDLDTSQFKDMPSIKTTWMIDVWSQTVTSITNIDGSTERIGSYGLANSLRLPEKSIPMDKLQDKLNSLLE